MADKKLPETREQLIAHLRARAREIKRALRLMNGDERSQWIVLSGHDVPLKFTIEGAYATEVASTNLEGATRLNHPTAESVAFSVVDGTGARGKAVMVLAAYTQAASSLRKLASSLKN